ncbi:MAG: hypothetical protein ABSA48_12780 [Terracidiphilus sp.]|jgi:hypothetical protein
MNPWVNVVSEAIFACATTIVAIYVAIISRRQWKTNHEKFRLDLYSRRFEIYLRVLEYFQELVQWDGSPKQISLQRPFIKAYAESKFMFPPESGIYAFLKEFGEHAFHIIKFEENKSMLSGMPEEQMNLSIKRTDHVNWIFGSMTIFEEKIAPYLNFHDA